MSHLAKPPFKPLSVYGLTTFRLPEPPGLCMTTIIAIQSCNSCLNQSHKYIARCVVAMYDYNNHESRSWFIIGIDTCS